MCTHAETHKLAHTYSLSSEILEKNKSLVDHGYSGHHTSFSLNLYFLYTNSFVAQALDSSRGRILEDKAPVPRLTVAPGSPIWDP